MGRKSLAAERRAQILDAFAVCLRKYGMEGCTLEKVVQEAGVQRSIIRHYIGNRDDMRNRRGYAYRRRVCRRTGRIFR